MNTVAVVRAGADPFDTGVRHGEARADALRAFLDDGLARLDHVLPTPTTLARLRPVIAAYDEQIAAQAPRLHEEMLGLAHGASISRDEAVLLQIRREVMAYQRIPSRGDCTAYARSGGEPVLAQTVDLNGNLDDQIAVLDTGEALVLSFAGLLGYLGVNRAGLAVGLNLVLGGEWRPGLPPYLAIRHLLDTAIDVEHAITLLRRLRLASSRSLMLCDATRTATVEILDDDVRVMSGTESAHTNHYLHPDFVAHDQLNVFARNSSLLRLKECEARLGSLPSDADAEQHFAVLSTAPICVADTGDIRRERTVAAVVLLPALGEMHLRAGDPSGAPTQVFGQGRAHG